MCRKFKQMKFIAGEAVRDKFSVNELKHKLSSVDAKTEFEIKEAEKRRLDKAVRSEQTYLELAHTDMSTFDKLVDMLCSYEEKNRDLCRLKAKRHGFPGRWWGTTRIQELAYDFAFWKFYHNHSWLAQHTEERVSEAFIYYCIKKMRAG